MSGDRFMSYPCCRNSCIYFASYVFFTSVNIIWLYLISFNNRGYIHFSENDSTIKFILTFVVIITTAVIARCGCIRDEETTMDNNLLSYDRY